MAEDKPTLSELRERLQMFEEMQRAMLNILEDFAEERLKFQLIQKATMNLLEDMYDERNKLEEAQRSLVSLNEVFEAEKRFSLLLQQALLPAIPVIGGDYNIAVEYVPVFVKREIGGDFYDIHKVSDCRVGVLIGDVSGKGLEAAAMGATTRSTIHAFVYEAASPGEALTRTDAVLASSQIPSELFVTVFLVLLDICTGDFTYSGAGHPPAMICRANGDVDILVSGEIPLGLELKRQFGENSGHLDLGDKLVFYTDGISEARYDSVMLELDGIKRILQENIQLNASDLAQALVKAATDWSDGKLLDDAAVVVIERMV